MAWKHVTPPQASIQKPGHGFSRLLASLGCLVFPPRGSCSKPWKAKGWSCLYSLCCRYPELLQRLMSTGVSLTSNFLALFIPCLSPQEESKGTYIVLLSLLSYFRTNPLTPAIQGSSYDDQSLDEDMCVHSHICFIADLLGT